MYVFRKYYVDNYGYVVILGTYVRHAPKQKSIAPGDAAMATIEKQ